MLSDLRIREKLAGDRKIREKEGLPDPDRFKIRENDTGSRFRIREKDPRKIRENVLDGPERRIREKWANCPRFSGSSNWSSSFSSIDLRIRENPAGSARSIRSTS